MTSFSIDGKIALITGGTSGIGLVAAKQLLQKKLKAVVIIGMNIERGYKARDQLAKEFGQEKVYYFKANVVDKYQLEEAYKYTISLFNQLDIVINSAGICDGRDWKKEIDINMKGTYNSTFLAFDEYLPKYKSSFEGVIINLSSIAALRPMQFIPTYGATKAAIVAFSTSLGTQEQYERTNVRIMSVCPGLTDTPMLVTYKTKGPFYDSLGPAFFAENPVQTVAYVGKVIINVTETGRNGSVWVIEGDKSVFDYCFIDPTKHVGQALLVL